MKVFSNRSTKGLAMICPKVDSDKLFFHEFNIVFNRVIWWQCDNNAVLWRICWKPLQISQQFNVFNCVINNFQRAKSWIFLHENHERTCIFITDSSRFRVYPVCENATNKSEKLMDFSRKSVLFPAQSGSEAIRCRFCRWKVVNKKKYLPLY